MTEDDYDWQPPTGAELKVIQARRDRSDKISQLMGDYLLKGYKMLGTSCAECSTILMRDRQGVDYCIACNELDSDVNKDNPAVNEAAALSQTREEQQRLPHPVVNGEVATPLSNSNFSHPPVSSFLPRRNAPTPSTSSRSEELATLSNFGLSSQIKSSQTAVEQKLQWATQELLRSTSIESSIQFCNLIKTCAETISALKRVQGPDSLQTGEEE